MTINVKEKLKFGLRREENMGKGENAVFSPFPSMFLKGLFVRVVKSWDCVVKS